MGEGEEGVRGRDLIMPNIIIFKKVPNPNNSLSLIFEGKKENKNTKTKQEPENQTKQKKSALQPGSGIQL